MSLAIIYCPVLENEIKAAVLDFPEVTHLESTEWGLHIQPDVLLETVTERILDLQDHFKAIMLGYGRCQAMDRLPKSFKIPVFYPNADDCIGVLLGQDRYRNELKKEAGTWFLTPGWTELGMEFIFHELQLNQIAKTDLDPLQLAHRILEDYTRTLFIEMRKFLDGKIAEFSHHEEILMQHPIFKGKMPRASSRVKVVKNRVTTASCGTFECSRHDYGRRMLWWTTFQVATAQVNDYVQWWFVHKKV